MGTYNKQEEGDRRGKHSIHIIRSNLNMLRDGNSCLESVNNAKNGVHGADLGAANHGL